jgi:DNA-binding SARP family transcriptional activator
VEFRILGPLEVLENGSPLPIAGVRQRALLAVLLLDANRVVSADRLIDELWGEDTPEDGRNALQVRVSQLRKVISGASLLTRAPGYVIEIEPGALDSLLFEELLATACDAEEAGEMDRAGALLREGLGLWRGHPLEDVSLLGPAAAEIRRLDELHLAALERRIDCDLALGEHTKLVPELQMLVEQHPLRERLRGQLMLALYRSGRQAEALATYRDVRRALVDNLGIEPGPHLQQLEHDVLTHALSLQLPARGPLQEDAVTASSSSSGPKRRRIASATPHRTFVQRHKWLLLLAALLAVALAIVLPLSLRSGGRAAFPNSVIAVPRSFTGIVTVDPGTGRVIRRIPLAGLGEGAPASGAGAFWVAGSTGVSKVDLKTGQTEQIPITGGANGLAVGDREGVWEASIDKPPFELLEIDPYRNTVSRQVSLPGRPTAGPYVGMGFVWLVVGANEIWKIDPADGKVVSRIPYNFPYVQTANAAAAGEGGFWFADPTELQRRSGFRFGAVIRVDAKTDEVTRIPVDRVNGLTISGGAVWARSGNELGNPGTGKVTEVNPATSRVIQTIDLGRTDWIKAGQDAVWVAITENTVVRLNPATGEVVGRLVLPKTAKDFGESGGTFWVLAWP